MTRTLRPQKLTKSAARINTAQYRPRDPTSFVCLFSSTHLPCMCPRVENRARCARRTQLIPPHRSAAGGPSDETEGLETAEASVGGEGGACASPRACQNLRSHCLASSTGLSRASPHSRDHPGAKRARERPAARVASCTQRGTHAHVCNVRNARDVRVAAGHACTHTSDPRFCTHTRTHRRQGARFFTHTRVKAE